jgi:hypothetical protein
MGWSSLVVWSKPKTKLIIQPTCVEAAPNTRIEVLWDSVQIVTSVPHSLDPITTVLFPMATIDSQNKWNWHNPKMEWTDDRPPVPPKKTPKKGYLNKTTKPNIGHGTALHYKTVVKRAYILHFYIAQIPKTRASRLYRMKPVDCVLKVDMIPNSYLRGSLCGTT